MESRDRALIGRWETKYPRKLTGGFGHVQHVQPNGARTKMGPLHEDQKNSAACRANTRVTEIARKSLK